MGKFDKFNKVLTEEDHKKIDEAKNNPYGSGKEVPAGEYEGHFEKMELAATKDGRPMFKAMFRITKGEFKKYCLFMNRVVCGTKNDNNMIVSVEGYINNLLSDGAEPIAFNGSYDDFAEDILDCAEDICGAYCKIEYDPDVFNNIHVLDIG